MQLSIVLALGLVASANAVGLRTTTGAIATSGVGQKPAPVPIAGCAATGGIGIHVKSIVHPPPMDNGWLVMTPTSDIFVVASCGTKGGVWHVRSSTTMDVKPTETKAILHGDFCFPGTLLFRTRASPNTTPRFAHAPLPSRSASHAPPLLHAPLFRTRPLLSHAPPLSHAPSAPHALRTPAPHTCSAHLG